MDYRRFTKKPEFDKACQTLAGIVSGICCDKKINSVELDHIHKWMAHYEPFKNQNPMAHIFVVLENILNDNQVSASEIEELVELVEWLQVGNGFYKGITRDLQKLQGIIQGIACDSNINDIETSALSEWLESSSHLKGNFPYDEVDTLLGKYLLSPTQTNHKELLSYLGQFSFVNRQASIDPVMFKSTVSGICARAPEIKFKGMNFCFTGNSDAKTREEYHELILKLDGKVANRVNQNVDYLIVCAEGNRAWAFECYGRKVEMAMQLRKEGFEIVLVHEFDLLDTLRDLQQVA